MIRKWEILIVSIVSIIFGYTILTTPEILMHYQTYEVLRWWFNPITMGSIFIVAGLSKILAVVIRSRRLKVFSVCLLVAAWLFTGISFHLASNPTTIHLFCYGFAWIAVGTLLREVVD